MFYDPKNSLRGALQCANRSARKKDALGYTAPLIIHNPHALPMFREPRSQKRQREKDLMDPVKAKRPDPGLSISGIGKGGKVGATGGTLLTQHLLKTRVSPSFNSHICKPLSTNYLLDLIGLLVNTTLFNVMWQNSPCICLLHVIHHRRSDLFHLWKGKMVSVEDEPDPREAILRHADKKDVFSLYTAAYRKTQPKPIFAESSDDSQEEKEDAGQE